MKLRENNGEKNTLVTQVVCFQMLQFETSADLNNSTVETGRHRSDNLTVQTTWLFETTRLMAKTSRRLNGRPPLLIYLVYTNFLYLNRSCIFYIESLGNSLHLKQVWFLALVCLITFTLPMLYRNLGVIPGYTAVNGCICMASDWHPEQRYWQNRETTNIGLDSSVGRAPAR